jgi:ABC-type glycerol-3-phosphate transport system permease component
MMHSIPGRRLIISAFLVFLLLPIYWLVNMSFKTNGEIVSTMTLWPHQPTIANYMRIFTDESWYSGYINSLKYVLINTVISISVALPASRATASSATSICSSGCCRIGWRRRRSTRCRSSTSIRRSACSIRHGR